MHEFMPHGHCYFWTPDVLWLNVLSDGAIAVAYFAIPLQLVFFMRRRSDLAFPWVFGLFSAFILACGSTHAFDIWTTWVPHYRAEGWLKAATAVISVTTAVALVRLIPKALALPSPEDLRREIGVRQQAEADVRRLNAQLEERVADRTRELERTNQELREFVHVVSHDLREPLRAVSNFTQLLGRRYGERLDDRGREYIGLASDGALRMQSMLGDLVRYARLERDAEEHVDVSLEEVLDEVVRDHAALLEESGAVLERPEPLPSVRGSRTQLHQLLGNLLTNAIKYAGDGPPLVRIEAHARDEGLELRVIDHGEGIPAEHRERVFEMFQRLHLASEVAGTGVGLAICRKIVERHGGEIEVVDTPNGGATFIVRIWTE